MWRQNIKRFISTEGGGVQLSCGLKAISVSNFSPEFPSQKKFFSNHNDRTCHFMFVNTVCTCDLRNFQHLVFVLSDFTTQQQQQYWVVRLLISQMEKIKDTVVISQGASVLLFPLSTSTFMLHNCCKTTNNDYSRVSRLSRLFLQHLPQNRSY